MARPVPRLVGGRLPSLAERSGPDDVLFFVTELGPPDWYAITGADGNELSDRWEEALLLKQHVRRIWERLADTATAP